MGSLFPELPIGEDEVLRNLLFSPALLSAAKFLQLPQTVLTLFLECYFFEEHLVSFAADIARDHAIIVG